MGKMIMTSSKFAFAFAFLALCCCCLVAVEANKCSGLSCESCIEKASENCYWCSPPVTKGTSAKEPYCDHFTFKAFKSDFCGQAKEVCPKKLPLSKEQHDVKIKDIRQKLDETLEIMKQNIEKVLNRGESIESLLEKTDRLSTDAFQFNMMSKKLAEKRRAKQQKEDETKIQQEQVKRVTAAAIGMLKLIYTQKKTWETRRDVTIKACLTIVKFVKQCNIQSEFKLHQALSKVVAGEVGATVFIQDIEKMNFISKAFHKDDLEKSKLLATRYADVRVKILNFYDELATSTNGLKDTKDRIDILEKTFNEMISSLELRYSESMNLAGLFIESAFKKQGFGSVFSFKKSPTATLTKKMGSIIKEIDQTSEAEKSLKINQIVEAEGMNVGRCDEEETTKIYRPLLGVINIEFEPDNLRPVPEILSEAMTSDTPVSFTPKAPVTVTASDIMTPSEVNSLRSLLDLAKAKFEEPESSVPQKKESSELSEWNQPKTTTTTTGEKN